MYSMIIKFAKLLNSKKQNVRKKIFDWLEFYFSVPHVTQIAVVGGKLESNGILDEENIDDDLKVFYVRSKKVCRTKKKHKNSNNKSLFFFSCIFIMNVNQIVIE